jgi:hypothetical protein
MHVNLYILWQPANEISEPKRSCFQLGTYAPLRHDYTTRWPAQGASPFSHCHFARVTLRSVLQAEKLPRSRFDYRTECCWRVLVPESL